MKLLRGIGLLGLCALSTLAEAQTCPAGNPRVAPDSRYVISEPVTGEQVVTDLATELMWKRCSEGQSDATCTGTAATPTWSAALGLANASTHAGFTDWRLPNREELRSPVETGCHSPSINAVAFPATASGVYWTSTTYAVSVSFAWGVSFNDGTLGTTNGKSVNRRARLVRGGPGLDAFDSGEFLLSDGFE